MELKAVHDTLEEIPEAYQSLYTEKGGKWELTGIAGIKTTADVARVETALNNEKKLHKETKASLKVWDGMAHDDVMKKLDRTEELEAAAGGKLDDAKIDEMATKRAEAMVKSRISPLDRQIKALKDSNGELTESNTTLTSAAQNREREDQLRPMLLAEKILPEHYEDVFMYSRNHLERNDDGGYFAREGLGAGLTAGAPMQDWLSELCGKRPGWLPGSSGGNARGSGPMGGAGTGSSNPWTHEGWNMTKQGSYYTEHGQEKANVAAKAAGTTVGGMRPDPKK